MPIFFKPILLATVFTTGAAVLIFEVAAVRALSPFFGTSIYVVSSVLTVILAALSLGYYFGGRLADRRPDVRILYFVIVSSGFMMNILYLLSMGFFPLGGAVLPVTYGPLILALCFFFIPAFMLGIDSPFVIKLLTKTGDDAHNGALVGSTFFWSTLGSIAGSLLSGFVLIPFLGLNVTFVGTAIVLSLWGCCSFLLLRPYASKQTSYPAPSIGLLLLITVMSVWIGATTLKSAEPKLANGQVIYHTDGYYSQIQVHEHVLSSYNTTRVLVREINKSSAIKLGSTEFLFQYPEYSRVYRSLLDSTKNYLVIGGGAYTIPRTLLAEDEELQIDVVEIEPGLFDLAQQYFELQDSDRLNNFSMDARYYMRTSDKKYDSIFIDVYQSGHFIPPHLTTQEFFRDVADHMTEEGVLVMNLIGETDNPERNITGSVIKTTNSIFPEVSVYLASNTSEGRRNLVVVARKAGHTTELPPDFMVDLKMGLAVPAIERLIPLSRFYLPAQQVLTDDLAPVEFLVAKELFRTEN